MSERLFSPDWHLVAQERFALRSNAMVCRQVNRGEVEYVVQNRLDGQHFRLTEPAYALVARLNGRWSLEKIWNQSLAELGDWVPTQHEVINLISQLYRAGLLRTASAPNLEVTKKLETRQQRQQWFAKLKNPLGVKIPFIDPDRFLNRTRWVSALLFSPIGWAIYSMLIVVAGIVALINLDALGSQSAQLFTQQNLLLMAVLYPIVKAIHELGHAYAAKRWGGEVHEIGIMLLVFFPIPYVDASSSGLFSNKFARMTVGGAGIMVELGLAAIATLLWAASEPGIAQAAFYNVMVLCGVSTLLFNGNPLLKFDAYYVLADWWEEPNLQKVANGQLGYLIKKHLLRLPRATGLNRSVKQNSKLVSYSVLSYLYRTFIMFTIAVFVATQFFFVGVIMACMSLFFGFFQPLRKLIMSPKTDPDLQEKPSRAWFAFLLVVIFLAYGLVGWSAPKTLSFQAIAVPTDSVELRAPISGKVMSLARPNQAIAIGEPLISIESFELQQAKAQLEGELRRAELNIELSEADTIAKERAQLTYQLVLERIQRLQEFLDQSEVRAFKGGLYLPADPAVELGQFVSRGQSLGQIVDADQLVLEGLIPESRASELTQVDVGQWQSLNGLLTGEARVLDVAPRGSTVVENPLLTLSGGGLLATSQDATGRAIAAEPQIRIRLTAQAGFRPYERLVVKLGLPPEPIAFRMYRALRASFLGWFSV